MNTYIHHSIAGELNRSVISATRKEWFLERKDGTCFSESVASSVSKDNDLASIKLALCDLITCYVTEMRLRYALTVFG